MKSIVYEIEAPYVLSRNEVELCDDEVEDRQILAETEFTVVSVGTEIAAWIGKPPLRPSRAYPRLIGYCNLARVKKVGRAVEELHEGEYVLTHQPHRTAYVCNASDVLLRVEKQSEGRRKQLAATYLYHLGYAALLSGGYRPGYQVAVVGIGTLGVTTASLVRAFGSQPFLFTDQEIGRTRLKELGFTQVFNKHSSGTACVLAMCEMDGADLVINTSDKWRDHLLAMQLARKGGEIVCLGFPGRGEPPAEFNPLDSQFFYDKQLTIRHCGYMADHVVPPSDIRFTLKRNMRYLSTLILEDRVNPFDILTIESQWENLAEVYQSLAARQTGTYTALIDWRS